MGKPYDQSKDHYLRMACTLVTQLNIMKYKNGMIVKPSFIMKVAIFFDSLGDWSEKFGAVFDIIYNSFVNQMNKKLKLKFKLVKTTVYDISESDTGTYGFGSPKYSAPFRDAILSGYVSDLDIYKMSIYKGKFYGHNMAWDGGNGNGGYIINTDGKTPAKASLSTMKIMANMGLIWKPLRTIEPADEETKQVCNFTRELARAEIDGVLPLLLIANKDKKYFEKATVIFYYGRK